MRFLFPILAFAALVIIAIIGANVEGLHFLFGVFIPYVAIAFFIIGIIVRIVKWARTPVPFRITTTCGQQKSLDFIRQNKLDSPYTGFQTVLRMFLEVVTFRSLFRNTSADIKEGPKLTYGASKWLWLFAIIFHYSFLMIVLRHFRFFVEPVPAFVPPLEMLDSFFQVGVPIIYMTSVGLIIGGLYLLFRRYFEDKIRYMSLPSDYFPLYLILGIAVTGVWMRHIDKVDLIGIKSLAIGIFTFDPVVPAGIDAMFYVHLFLVCSLLIYFPMSKLVHAPGVFLSPTRNMPNNNRAERYENPWNDEFKMHHHTYEEYEDEFRPMMKAADMPLEKDVEEEKNG